MITLKKIANEWDRNAILRCRQLHSGTDISHDRVLVPTILRLAGNLQRRYVLDVGCGCGCLSSAASARGGRVLAIDISAKMIAEAEKEFGSTANLQFKTLSVENLARSHKCRFDMCLANMSIITMPDLDRALSSISTVLRPAGRLVFSIAHPCFWNLYRKDEPLGTFDYWSCHPVSAPFRISLDQRPLPSRTTYLHRPITEYVRSLRDAGFGIESIVEPRAPRAAPSDYRKKFTLPRFMVLSVLKGR